MLDMQGREMHLTPTAERVCSTICELGARPTRGHRNPREQAHDIAENVIHVRNFVRRTYLNAGVLQLLIDKHAEWKTVSELTDGIDSYFIANPDMVSKISHHTMFPSPCFDLDFKSVNDQAWNLIRSYQREGVIKKVLTKEADILKCHIECAMLVELKTSEQV